MEQFDLEETFARIVREAAASRRVGGRPHKLTSNQIRNAQVITRRLLERTDSRQIMVRAIQQYLHQQGVDACDSTVVRCIIQPVRGIRKQSRKFGKEKREE